MRDFALAQQWVSSLVLARGLLRRRPMPRLAPPPSNALALSLLAVVLAASLIPPRAAAQDLVADTDPTPPAVSPSLGGTVATIVVEQAGVGGPITYGAAGVLETGGYASVAASDLGAVGILRPYVGWFVTDGFELSLANDLVFRHVDDTGLQVTFAGTLEPSGHIPLVTRLWLAIGCGVGVLWNGIEAGFLATPRLGLDLLVGRSGMLHMNAVAALATTPLLPSLLYEPIGSQWRVGVEIGYSALF